MIPGINTKELLMHEVLRSMYIYLGILHTAHPGFGFGFGGGK
jgi:hypothetical protein